MHWIVIYHEAPTSNMQQIFSRILYVFVRYCNLILLYNDGCNLDNSCWSCGTQVSPNHEATFALLHKGCGDSILASSGHKICFQKTALLSIWCFENFILDILCPCPIWRHVIGRHAFKQGIFRTQPTVWRDHRVIILLQRACLHNRIERNWCKFSRPECATSQTNFTRDCALIG